MRDAIPHVFCKCAEAIEKKEVERISEAAVCAKCVQAIERAGDTKCVLLQRCEYERTEGYGGKVPLAPLRDRGSKVSNGARLHSSEYHESFTMSINIF